MERERCRPPHVAVLLCPGMGHVIPLAEFAKRLVLHHNFTVTLITFSDFSSQSQTSSFNALPHGISSVSLPSVPLDDLPPDAYLETRLSLIIARSVPQIRSTLLALNEANPLAAYVIDLFGGDTLPVAKELNLPHYMFFTSTLFMLSFMFHLPTLHETTSCEFRDLPETLRLPGCVPLRGEDFLHPIKDRTSEVYPRIVHSARRFREAEGILVNSFEAMEPGAARVLMEEEEGRPPVYPVGPIIWAGSSERVERSESECLKWLDEQPRGSVLYVSFGSGGTISCKQTTELALGLEMSGQRFLWVVRTPNDMKSDGTFLNPRESNDSNSPLVFLPDGFLERTNGRGIVVPLWAPQVEVLSHGSTAGFMSHCGWNSTLESVANGVPMIAWPLYAEQRMNAVMLVEGLKVALRPEGAGMVVVGRDEISKVVKELMEGEKGKVMRERVRDMQEAAAMAVSEEGSSFKKLAEVANKWKNPCAN